MTAGRVLRRPASAAAALLLLAVTAAAVLAPWIAPYAPQRMDVVHRLSAPAALHWLGTDDFGRDVLSRLLAGARLSLGAGALVVVVSLVCGTAMGLLAGVVRPLEEPLMRVADALMAFPDILLAIALMAALGPSLSDVVIALGVVYTPRVARLVRAAVLVLREMPFIEAAWATGARPGRVMLRHLLPNLLSPLLVQGTLIFAAAILTEAALSFLGAGIPPPTASWGNMVAGSQQYLDRAEWLILAPGLAIVATSLSLQVLGDALRDAMDPRLRSLT